MLNDKLHGFYRSEFTDGGGVTHVIATTQFEATDARRAFPCFDEPDRKAVFSVTLDVPDGLEAYSNGPEVDDVALAGGGRRVRFGDTIAMSTYLVAFVVGPLEATEPVMVRGTPIRVVHTPGKGDLTAFALEAAAHSLEFFTDWFGIDYPAEKLDLLAIPDFAFGAMENLGCVTFREAVLLVDPARASRTELERVADVISHEIAHMWFGDLVTMRWWNGIWLNEAFATLMELLCVDHFRPDWQRWVSFGVERDAAMATDGLHATRPVEYPVGPPEEAQGMFDVLTYQKGAGVLRMLERYLGAERFRDGVRRYLESHRLGNTETADLWDAIEAASGEPVRHIMDTWILQGGFPLVSVDGSGPGGAPDPDPGSVPLRTGVRAQRHRLGVVGTGDRQDDRRLGRRAPCSVRHPRPSASRTTPADGRRGQRRRLGLLPGPVLRPSTTAAWPRTWASSSCWSASTCSATRGPSWSANSPAPTTSSSWPRRSATRTTPPSGPRSPGRWRSSTGPSTTRPVPSWPRTHGPCWAPCWRAWGGTARAGEGPRTPTLRAQMVAALGTIGADPEVRAEAQRRLDAAERGTAALDPDLASAIIATVAASGGPEDFDRFVEHYRHPATPQEEIRYLYALAGFTDPYLAARTFEFARTDVRSQDAPFVIQLLLAGRDNGVSTWQRGAGALGRARRPYPGQHRAPHARRGDVAVP